MKALFIYLLLFTNFLHAQQKEGERSSTWEEILTNKKGSIVCYWQGASPFIYQENSKMKGIEYELMTRFIDYLEATYNVKINVVWHEVYAFNEVFNAINYKNNLGFGLASMSYTEERSRAVNFTPSYMPDIAVVVSGRSIAQANSKEEFDNIFNELDAYTVQESTLERMLVELRVNNKLDFKIKYIDRLDSIIQHVISTENSFAYVDLPSYMMALDNNKEIRRQYFHAVRLEGFGFIYPLNSDWEIPVKDYFNTTQFKNDIAQILKAYLGEEVVGLIHNLENTKNFGSSEENMILSKEKDLQTQEMFEIRLKSEKRKTSRNLFIAGFLALMLVALFLYVQFKLKARANQRLIELNQEMSNLMQVVSHDIRTPVNQLLGLLNIIKLEGEYLKGDHKELINKLIDGGKRINDMATKILDVEALEANVPNFVFEAIELTPLINSLVGNVRDIAKEKGIKIKVKIDVPLHEVKADSTYLIQVFENLISNALKFSDSDSTITIEAYNLNNLVEVKVIDQGPGISEEEKPMLFKKFQKLSPQPTGGESSTGLGLSIVKKYVEAMKGTVSCESDIGKGSTFIIRLKKA